MASWRQRRAAALAAAAVLVAVVLGTYSGAEQIGLSTLAQTTAHRVEIYAASLQSELKRHEYLPPVVSLNSEVLALLSHPSDAALKAVVNNYLRTVSMEAGASAIYLMNVEGLTLAASNWDQPGSFVSLNFAYRPYFQDALQGRPGRFYGIGTVSREPGYYFSHGILRNGKIVGVVAVKVNLDKLDRSWQQPGEKVLVADGNGVIFLSSEPGWKFKTFDVLPEATVGRLQTTRQYSEIGSLSPVGFHEQRSLQGGTTIMAVTEKAALPGSGLATVSYLARRNPVPGTDWHISVLTDISAQRSFAKVVATVAALVVVLLHVLLLYFLQRRKFVNDMLETKAALQRANDDLEQKVDLRTKALSDSNQQLQTEISERRRAEETLKATLNELVHAAKMAALGKIVAGITHELNQPLAALRTLSANTIVFLARGQRETVESNLDLIGHLAEHMGKITSRLKRFARKSVAEKHPVNVTHAISNASLLLAQVVRERHASITVQAGSSPLYALCDGSRLEQVLVNLLGNALDAVGRHEAGAIEVRAFTQQDALVIEVHDNGEGISADVAPHLFEPFFSTKDQGVGLGLGLAISADIVREFGGSLKAGDSPLGGAVFVVRLPLAQMEQIPDEEALHV